MFVLLWWILVTRDWVSAGNYMWWQYQLAIPLRTDCQAILSTGNNISWQSRSGWIAKRYCQMVTFSIGNLVENGENVVLLFRQQEKRLLHLCQSLTSLFLICQCVLPHNKALRFVRLLFLYRIGVYLGCVEDLVWEDEVSPRLASTLLLRLVWVEDGLLVLQPGGEEEEVVSSKKAEDLFVGVLRNPLNVLLTFRQREASMLQSGSLLKLVFGHLKRFYLVR